MDNKIEVFKNEQFGEIRTALIENEPWFVAVDVCRALEIGNSSQAISRLDADEKMITLISNEGNKRGNPNMTVVNEPGLYTLILSSRKPEAKAFKRWITHEVIPTIRKTGGYMTDSLLERIQKEPAVIVEFAQALILEKNRVKALECELNTAKPKADYYDAFINPDDCTNIRTTAKELKIPERKFVQFLLKEKYLFRSPSGQLLPYNKDSNAGLFIVRDFVTFCYSKKGQGRSAESHYPTMCIEDIKALPVGELAAKDCALFLWITFPCLCEALEVLTAWGFSYKTVAFVWVKQNRRNDDLFTGMGYWTRANAEICILATKGHPKRVDAGVRQVILSHIEEHSKKPDEARERIVRLMGDLPRVELFARQSPEGWDVWGNEVECTAHLPMEETPCCG